MVNFDTSSFVINLSNNDNRLSGKKNNHLGSSLFGFFYSFKTKNLFALKSEPEIIIHCTLIGESGCCAHARNITCTWTWIMPFPVGEFPTTMERRDVRFRPVKRRYQYATSNQSKYSAVYECKFRYREDTEKVVWINFKKIIRKILVGTKKKKNIQRIWTQTHTYTHLHTHKHTS